MEIEQLRQEINDLLENVVKHSNSYTGKKELLALDASLVLNKVNKVQEGLTVLKYLLEVKHNEEGDIQVVSKSLSEIEEIIIEEAVPVKEAYVEEFIVEPLSVEVVEDEPLLVVKVRVEPQIQEETVVDIEIPKKEVFAQPAIKKITDGLTLNDRYLFANELCGKDMNAFNELVKAIDNCESLDQATKMYSTMDWEIDNEHVVTFTNLVERRFS